MSIMAASLSTPALAAPADPGAFSEFLDAVEADSVERVTFDDGAGVVAGNLLFPAIFLGGIFLLNSRAGSMGGPGVVGGSSGPVGVLQDKNRIEMEPDQGVAPTSRRSWLALLVPVGVGAATQAPLIALIVNPPDQETREGMLESWCTADYCTLLGGGAGYAPSGASFPGNYVEPESE